jgi:arginase
MNTPQSVPDGALDWMGVAHLLGLPETVPSLAGDRPATPMLRPIRSSCSRTVSSTDFERRTIADLAIEEVGLAQVASDPAGAAPRRRRRLGATLRAPPRPRRRGRPGLPRLSRSPRRLVGTGDFVSSSSWPHFRSSSPHRTGRQLTICEVNPDHDPDGSSMRRLSEALADVLSGVPGPGRLTVLGDGDRADHAVPLIASPEWESAPARQAKQRIQPRPLVRRA